MVCCIPGTGLDSADRKETSKDLHSLVVCILEGTLENVTVNMVLKCVTIGRVGGGVHAALSVPGRHLKPKE